MPKPIGSNNKDRRRLHQSPRRSSSQRPRRNERARCGTNTHHFSEPEAARISSRREHKPAKETSYAINHSHLRNQANTTRQQHRSAEKAAAQSAGEGTQRRRVIDR